MTDRISVQKTTENAETVRKARDMAWLATLMIALSPTSYVFSFVGNEEIVDPTKTILFVVIPVLLAARLVFVAVRLGSNLKDHDYLAKMKSCSYPPLYLAARLIGMDEGAE